MDTSKAAVTASTVLGKVLSVIGYTGASFFLIGAFAIIPDFELSTFIVCLVCIALFALLIIKGMQIKRRIKRFRHYVSLISSQQMTSLENLAASTSQSLDFVKKDLQKMIDKKFFAKASLDLNANEIVIGGGAAPAMSVSAARAQQLSAAVQPVMELYKCAGCGASGSKQKGVPGTCEYCGAHLI